MSENSFDRVSVSSLDQQAGPGKVAELLVATIRGVAHRKTSVGTRILVTVIPRKAVARAEVGDFMVSMHNIDTDNASSLYFGEGGDPGFAVDYACQGVIHRGSTITSSREEAEKWFGRKCAWDLEKRPAS